MYRIKFYSLLSFLSLGLLISSCDKDDDNDSNVITITIEEPTEGEVITLANCADVHIHIDVLASDENHEIEVVLHPEGDVDDKIIDYDAHEHDSLIEFAQEVDLCSYPSGTCFHLEVAACVDHDCAEKATADVEFCLE
ncbi:MAG: hypothetical protein ACPG49_05540 [Chitinophagales bacterium]